MYRTHLSTLLVALAGTVLIQVCHADPFNNANESTVAYARADIPAAMRCKDLIATSDYQYTIIAATEINDGTVPVHCRVTGLVPSEVRFELNLPAQWNGRLYMYGNGGLAGTPAADPAKQQARDQALAHGFATIYTDTGHDRRIEPGGTFAYNNLHKLIDYGFRAVHLSVVTAKSVATTFYDKPPQYSYWNGCSTGGRQAMIAAQRFPQDFDGIIAGAPAADYSGLKFSQASRVAAISRSGLEEAEVLALAGHIYAKCDALDGAADGLIDDPRRCRFDIDSDLPKCKGKDTDSCFDQRELAALKKYYAPVMLGDQQVYPAMPVGSEVAGYSDDGTGRTGWYPWLINSDGPVLLDLLGSDFFRYMVFV
jgi:feruloyl esterase